MTSRHGKISALIICALSILLASCSSSSSDVLRVRASIDGKALEKASPSDPLAIRPDDESTLALQITNPSTKPVEIKRVRIEGDMLSLTFLTYDVRVKTVVAPGETRQLDVPLDFFDLDRQATGYLRAHLRLYDVQRERISNDDFAVDIRGSLTSTMGLFGLMLLVLTALSAARNLRDWKRRLLPVNRFRRGLRFLVPGLGVGLLLSVGFSILRIFPLPATSWVPLTLLPAGIGFAIGFLLTLAPADDLPNDDEMDAEDDELVERVKL